MNVFYRLLSAAAFLAVLSVCLPPVPATAREKLPVGSTVHFGIAQDSDSELLSHITTRFSEEIGELLAGDYTPEFRPAVTLGGDLGLARAEEAVRALLDDPEVDIVLTVGYLTSTAAMHMGPLPKPLIAPFGLDAELQGMKPAPGGGSGIVNLSYLSAPSVVTQHIDILRGIVPFRKLAVIGPEAMFDTNPQWHQELIDYLQKYELEIVRVPLSQDIAATLAGVPADADAASVLTSGLTYAQITELAEGLIARGLPSFSFVGGRDVELGILAGMQSDQKVSRFARRVALNVQNILLGTAPSELPVGFSVDSRLTINLATARAIGVSLPWETRLEAVLINDEPPPDVPQLTLRGVMLEAMQVNLDLKAEEEAVAAGRYDVDLARSRLLPQAEIGARGVVIDEDRAAASFGSQAERTYTASASVSQLLYSEKAWANHAIQKHLQTAREQELEQLRLDVALEAAEAYLNVLRANTLERIQRENLQLSQSNLEQARVRESVGVAGPAEVYRWEAEIAQRRNDLIVANSQRNLAEIQLNRVLNRPLEGKFVLADAVLDRNTAAVDENWMQKHLSNPVSFRRLRVWIVEEAERNAPELLALDAAIAAQRRALSSAGRAYWLPTVALQGAYDRILDRGGAGVGGFDLDAASIPPDQPLLAGVAEYLSSVFPEPPDDDNWSVGLSVSLPLFEGGARRAEQLKARRDLSLLRRQRDAVALRVAQRARSTAHSSGASFANIRHSRAAAAAAARTLDVVADAYSRGAADVLDLLDAQNAALVTDQVAANAVYDFLIDYMNVERAMGRFELMMEEEERRGLVERLDGFMNRREIEP